MLINEDAIKKVREIYRNRFNSIIFKIAGPEALSHADLQELINRGLIDPNDQSHGLISDAYHIARIRGGDPFNARHKTSLLKFREEIKRLLPKLSQREQFALDHVKRSAGNFITKLRDNTLADIEGSIRSHNYDERNKMLTEVIRPTIEEGIEGAKVTVREVASRLRERTGDTYRDWKRVCFVGGTKIICKEGEKNIEDVKVGDEVMTHDGRYRKVLDRSAVPYCGDIIVLRTKNGILEVTPEHLILIDRDGQEIWIEAEKILKDDRFIKAKGFNTFLNKEWLFKKYYSENLTTTEIGSICHVSYSTIVFHLKKFGIPIKQKRFDTFLGKKHSSETIQRMKASAIKNNNIERITTLSARNKAYTTLRNSYKSGKIKCWNKDKNKNNNFSVFKISESLKNGFRNGRETWSKGLTKNHPILKIAGEKWRENYNNKSKEELDRKHEKHSKIIAEKIASGAFHTWSNCKRGYWINRSTCDKEYYGSSYELKFMLKMNSMNVHYTKYHGIIIKYKDENGITKRYVPDFLVNSSTVIEIKPLSMINKMQNQFKFHAAKKYCDLKGLNFEVLTEKELGL